MTHPQVRRDETQEAAWLALAETKAGRSGFARHVTARLLAGESAFGNRWAGLGLARLLVELTEEAADLGSWGVLALQALELEELPGETRERLGRLIEQTIALGASAHRGLVQARLELTRRPDSPAGSAPDVDGVQS